MALSAVVVYFLYKFNIAFRIDLNLLSIAIIFPLVFAIRGSFRRREKALEHLSEFRSTLKTVGYFFMSNDELTDTDKAEMKDRLLDINTTTLNYLKNGKFKLQDIDMAVDKIYDFTLTKEPKMSKGLREKIFRFMKDLHESIENLHAIHTHRTPISLKAYCEVFIYIFPFIYVPSVIFSINAINTPWITYAIVLTTQFILISLYNIQNQLEYPFDNVGLDDINLDSFKIER